MSSRKIRKSERLIDKTVGISASGKPNVTEAWQKILQESSNEFTELNHLLMDSEVFPNQDDSMRFHDHDEGFGDPFTDSNKDILRLSNAESGSTHSIQPGPITLEYDFNETSYESDIAERNPNFAVPEFVLLSACCLSGERKENMRLRKAQMSVKKCDQKISDYCHQLKVKFESMESLLRFHLPDHGIRSTLTPPVVNVASAQLWFITFALAREFNHTAQMDRRDMIFLRKKYQVLLAYAHRLSSDVASIDDSLTRIEEKVIQKIHTMKEALTGSSRTDLTNFKITQDDDFFVEGRSWTELAQPRTDHVNRYQPSPEKDAVPSVSYLYETLDRPDSLTERKQLEIFVKNVTKSGWKSYEESFSSGKRMKLLRLLLSQTMGIIAQAMEMCAKVKKKLIAAAYHKVFARLTCHETLIPWFCEIKHSVNFCVQSTKFGSSLHEFLRYYIFSSEMRFKRVLSGARDLRNNVQDICEVATISCDLLERKYELLLPNYAQIRPHIKLRTKEHVTEDTAVAAFYLHGYGNVLKQSQICFRITRFILSKSIQLEERHSGADFGTRFFSKSNPFLTGEN